MSDKEFQSAVLSTGKSARFLADYLMVSVPTIERWMTGRNFPHPLVRKGIVDKLSLL